MNTSTRRAPGPRRQQMASIVVAGAVPLALVLGGITNAAPTWSTTVAQSDYLQVGLPGAPEPPPEIPPEQINPEHYPPEHRQPEQTQPEQYPQENQPSQTAAGQS
ncbi:hypothetical protein [Nocardia nepalensis]|uniref:hypothetical protein n=1 Tax=Nocardia nepalensis TaxID=3375448 RepID=UPI003B67D8E2